MQEQDIGSSFMGRVLSCVIGSMIFHLIQYIFVYYLGSEGGRSFSWTRFNQKQVFVNHHPTDQKVS